MPFIGQELLAGDPKTHLSAHAVAIFQSLLQVDTRAFAQLAQWQYKTKIVDVLVEMRREMASPQNKKLPQPAEGTVFPHNQ